VNIYVFIWIYGIDGLNKRAHNLLGKSEDFFGGGGEGPHSRCYARTAALRLVVQPCDEDG
jgi:hypothetical protein